MTFWPRFCALGAAAALSTALLLAPVLAVAQSVPPTEAACSAPVSLTRLQKPLHRMAQLLRDHHPVRIVAIGSSSTAGSRRWPYG